jgi:hypothetical protein
MLAYVVQGHHHDYRHKGEIIMADMAKLADTATLARLVADPKGVAIELGVTDEEGIRDLERLAYAAHNAVQAAGTSAGLQMRAADWGIGAGCCNSRVMALRSLK